MSISADGWVSWARRVPGPADKVYSQRNRCQGVACHSVVGREDDFSDGIPNRFLDTSRLANGRYTDNAAASVHFVLRENGTLIQMYPIHACTWTSGGPDANTSTISIEAEGGLAPNYGEPLTAAAAETFCRLMVELRTIIGPANPGVNLFQHKELARMYGTSPTACASDRYANAWARAVREAEEETADMTPAEREEHQALVAIMGGREKILTARAGGMDFLMGYALEQAEQNELEATVRGILARRENKA